MAMNRILEFSPSQEEAVVSRILVLVHQTVDECFPAAAKASRQFTKTVFSEEGERTAIGELPGPSGTPFGVEEDTASDNRPPPPSDAASDASSTSQHALPKPPTLPPPPRPSVVPSSRDANGGERRSQSSRSPLRQNSVTWVSGRSAGCGAAPLASTAIGGSSVMAAAQRRTGGV